MKKAIGITFALMLLVSTPIISYGVTVENEPKIEIIELEDGQCTARIIEPDGTIYEVTADTCLEAVLGAKALKNIDK